MTHCFFVKKETARSDAHLRDFGVWQVFFLKKSTENNQRVAAPKATTR
jgi:hypothetical protein